MLLYCYYIYYIIYIYIYIFIIYMTKKITTENFIFKIILTTDTIKYMFYHCNKWQEH